MVKNSDNKELMAQWQRDKEAYGPHAFKLWEINIAVASEPEQWERCLTEHFFESIPEGTMQARHKDRRIMGRDIVPATLR